MKLFLRGSVCILFSLLCSFNIHAGIIYVSSQQEFDNAHDNATMNDSIVWRDGTYADIFMDIDNDNLFITAENLGRTIFTDGSRVDITGDYITLKGFQFLYGDIGTRDVINTRGSYNVFTQMNISAYTCYKYLRVREESRYCEITYCNFENRLNLDDQNILSILVDDDEPGYHKIQYCSFKNFDGTGNDLGIEPIRIGLSTQGEYVSRCVVEYCYFTQCDGDGEIISNKARQNVFRYNTFENNPLAELVLRHGSEAIVYGNFFLNNKGGIRVREGQDHYIYNNYFQDIHDRPIYLQNDDSDPLDNINIAFNTIVDCDEFRLGGNGNDQPTNVTFVNNIFTDPKDDLFEDETGNETWIGNVAFGDFGIPLPADGVSVIDPLIEENVEGYFGLSSNSPAIDASQTAFIALPLYPGVDGIDSDILFDLMGQARPAIIEQKDVGCNEYPQDIIIQPIATEANTGPSYDTTPFTSIQNIQTFEKLNFELIQNPVSDRILIKLDSENKVNIKFDIYALDGRKIESFADTIFFPGIVNLSKDLSDTPPGVYFLHGTIHNSDSGIDKNHSIKFIKL